MQKWKKNALPVSWFLEYRNSKSSDSLTVWPEWIWIKVKSWWQILPQHQSTYYIVCSTYLRAPESASIEIPLFRPHFIKVSKTVFLWSKSYFTTLKFIGTFISKFWSERGMSIVTDSGPPLRHVLWYCGSFCHQLFSFIPIGCGHTVNCEGHS